MSSVFGSPERAAEARRALNEYRGRGSGGSGGNGKEGCLYTVIAVVIIAVIVGVIIWIVR
jgi:hypothetical protein